MNKKNPAVRPSRVVIQDSGDPGYVNRLLVGTPTTGLVRVEWVAARYSQIIPVNWSQVSMSQYMNSFFPLRYQVADAQNLIVKEAITKDFEWLLLIEHDNIIPQDTFIRFDEYIREEKIPVVSGLYFTRSRPSYPLLFRGVGNGAYYDWQPGDKVWCSGVPTGCLLIHCGLLRKMWDDSPEYQINYGQPVVTRRVFDSPHYSWTNPDEGQVNTIVGTSDLNWCKRVMEGDYFRKSGWTEFADNLPEPDYPFLVDTNIFCKHINPDGEQFP